MLRRQLGIGAAIFLILDHHVLVNINDEKKENLILVQAFPANENLTEGAIKVLSEVYNVHFINFPGFHPKEDTLDEYSFDQIVKYVEDRVAKLDLDTYILGGASFGFSVINSMDIDRDRVIAIFGFMPYLGKNFHTMDKGMWHFLRVVLSATEMFHIHEKVWGKVESEKALRKVLGRKFGLIVKSLFDDTDPVAFLEISKTVLNYNQPPKFKEDMPYILLLNPEDETVDYKVTVTEFLNRVPHDKLKIVTTQLPHFPRELTYEYFKERITDEEIDETLKFIEYAKKLHSQEKLYQEKRDMQLYLSGM